ncbi:Golgin sub A member 2 [Desmophyllum pertusum]|uniref:Golgin sub A member 2 n=1 Tax=Desmophyllum pertusum TaxID=174260 RepID=A0A9X0A5Z8_9CNID|nr:Golgin sub A member 2 [Desmophyllum pertusum]
MSSRPSSAAKRPSSSAATNGGRKSVGSSHKSSSSMEKPPSGKTKNVAQGLLSKEEEYMRLNAELEERTASLIKEAEEVMPFLFISLRDNTEARLMLFILA